MTLTATGPRDEFVLQYSGGNYTEGTDLYVDEPLRTWRGKCESVFYGERRFHTLVFRCVDGHSDWIAPDGYRFRRTCPGPEIDPRVHELGAPFEVEEVAGRLTIKPQFPEPFTVFFPWYFPHVGKGSLIGN